MIIISHRGNIDGTNPRMENSPNYIQTEIDNKFHVEIDLWDVDIILMGEVKNKPHLKNILNQAVKLGFDNRLLIDIAWRGGLPGDTIWSRDKIINYAYIRKQTNTENWMIEVSETSTIETLIDGLYKCTLNDTLSAETKFKDKNYELNYKKLEL